MKANEAPEKLYLHPTAKRKVGASWLTFPLTNEDIEYVRKDAFIEKALAYLNEKFYFNNLFYGIVCTDFHAMEEMYEDFRKYMKGE